MDKDINIIVAICDDDKLIRNKVRNLLEEYQAKNNVRFIIMEYGSGEELLSKREDFDILLLDIDMPGLNGIETAEYMRHSPDRQDFVIIILSGMTGDWIKEAYKTRAIRYVSKPISDSEFYEAFRVALDEVNPGIAIRVHMNMAAINIYSREIIYAEAKGDFILIHTGKGVYDRSESLKGLMDLICDDDFFMIHRSYLVNLKWVTGIFNGYVKMKNGEKLPYARRRKNELMEAWANSRF